MTIVQALLISFHIYEHSPVYIVEFHVLKTNSCILKRSVGWTFEVDNYVYSFINHVGL